MVFSSFLGLGLEDGHVPTFWLRPILKTLALIVAFCQVPGHGA